MSQIDIIGLPKAKSWDEYEFGCLTTFGGGYRSNEEWEIFHHGIVTVFNLLRAEFPSPELCKSSPDLLAILEELMCEVRDSNPIKMVALAVIAKAKGTK